MKTRTISIGIVGLLVIGGFVGLFSVINQVSAGGPTYVSGSITSDTTWELLNSPYIVVGDVTVETGATLTIEPGVEVKFDGLYSIIVDGTLHAIGNSGNKIIFTSNKTTPAKGDWYTIRLRTEYNLIEYVEIEYATYGVFITFYGANNKVSNATVKYCKFDGIYITNSDDNIISDCTITSNDRYGITIYDSDKTEVKNSVIQYNSFFGINLNASTYTQIKDCNISYNDGKGILLYSDSHHTMISDCEIDSNNNKGIDLSGTSNNEIINTMVRDNNGVGIDFGGETTDQRIENCDTINNEGTGIDLWGSSNVDIVGCNISNNKGDGGIYSGSIVSYVVIKNTEVCDNSAENNSAGNGIDLFGGKNINIEESSVVNNGGNGIRIGTSNSEFNTVNKCYIYKNTENGIYITAIDNEGANRNNISNSFIYENGLNGIHFDVRGWNYRPTAGNYNNIFNNDIYKNGESGIYFKTGSCDSQADNNFINENNIYSNNKNGIYFYAYYHSSTDSNYIYDNDIYSNSANGIYFVAWGCSQATNNQIYQNAIHDNTIDGIFMEAYQESSSIYDNHIFDNQINSNDNGIHFYAHNPYYYAIVKQNIINNNTITSNKGGGIFLNATNDGEVKSHTISNCFISDNNVGIHLKESYSNTLRYNLISSNSLSGIFLTSSSSDNIIENNQIISNDINGILIIDNSNSNLITRNDISTNSQIGLNITESSGSLIHHNNFKNNVQNAYDSTIALNDWDDGAEGNCWSDYAGSDDDGDGFGEDPYIVPGGGSRDWHPFMNYVDIAAPYITITKPENGESNISVDSTISITFSKEMNTTTVEGAISLSGDLIPTDFVWDAGNEKVTLTPSSDLSSGTTYTVTITTDAKDLLGNRIEETYLFSFTSNDNEPPEISLTSPFESEADVEAISDIVVSFNEPMQPSTISYSCIPNPGGWNIYWNSNNTIATFSHDNFGSEVTYIFQITAGKDNSDLDLISGLVPNPWSFTTEDFIPPVITSTSPSDKTSDVSIETEISITFSEEMNHQSVEDNIYTIFAYGTTWNGNTITLIPTSELSYYTEYTVTIGSNAKDTADNAISSSNSFTFITEKGEKEPPEPKNHPPEVTVSKPNSDIADKTFTIQWSATDQDNEPLSITLCYDIDKNSENGMTVIDSDIGNTGSYVWDTSNMDEGDYYVHVAAADGSEEVGTYSWQLTIDHPNGVGDDANPNDDNKGNNDENNGDQQNSDNEKDTEEYPIMFITWIWLLILTIMIVFLIGYIFVSNKAVTKGKESMEPVDENTTSQEIIGDNQDVITQSESKVLPPPPPPPPPPPMKTPE